MGDLKETVNLWTSHRFLPWLMEMESESEMKVTKRQ